MQGLVNALDPVATAHSYPLAWAQRGLFDDRPTMNIDVCWRGDAAPKDSVRFGGMEDQRSHEAGSGYIAQQETAHLPDPGETLNPRRCYASRRVLSTPTTSGMPLRAPPNVELRAVGATLRCEARVL